VTSAIIVAAGKGVRMGPNMDKLFLPLAGQPVIAHTWQQFDAAECIDEVVLVVREGMQNAFEELAPTLELSKPYRLVPGGAERQDSVWNGLQALSPEAEIVAIQDGARPCTSPELIVATVVAARQIGAAVAAQRVSDTMKESEDGKTISRHLERQRLWAVQTPQTFRVEVIRQALGAVRAKGLHVTDDTAACHYIGQQVQLIESATPNPKVTVPSDLPYLELLLKAEEQD
jgi:2-C-methyl-D-erythritol 4-phosphate cytidylyltransferase